MLQAAPRPARPSPEPQREEPPGGRGGDWRVGPPITAPRFLTSPGSRRARGAGGSGSGSPALRDGRKGGREPGTTPCVPTAMGPASHSHLPSIGRG